MSSFDDPGWEEIEERREECRRRLGTPNPGCAHPGCPESDPLALTGMHPEIYCYEHNALRKGRPWLEDHHLSGQANDETTAQVPGNDRRAISERQNATWSRETLRNPDGSPLLRAAATPSTTIDSRRSAKRLRTPFQTEECRAAAFVKERLPPAPQLWGLLRNPHWSSGLLRSRWVVHAESAVSFDPDRSGDGVVAHFRPTRVARHRERSFDDVFFDQDARRIVRDGDWPDSVVFGTPPCERGYVHLMSRLADIGGRRCGRGARGLFGGAFEAFSPATSIAPFGRSREFADHGGRATL